MSKPMTNYNGRLDEIICDTLNGEGVYREYSGKVKAAGQVEAKQAITSLIKELVEKAKPEKPQGTIRSSDYWEGYYEAKEVFEQNLLEGLEEV